MKLRIAAAEAGAALLGATLLAVGTGHEPVRHPAVTTPLSARAGVPPAANL